MENSEISRIWKELANFRNQEIPLILGITGGIASGKSTVAEMFAKLGVPAVDFDQLSRVVVEPEKPAWREVVAYFGKDITFPDGHIDRKRLSQIVFQNIEKRKKLESFVHPWILAEFLEKLKELTLKAENKIIQVLVPLLFEANLQHLFHKTLLVYIPSELQIERLMKRDQITRDLAVKMLAAQWPIDEKRRWADFLIDNSGPLSETEKQVQKIWQTLQNLVTKNKIT
ncbi:MAG: dephospho-CoA kinase [Thermodesulfobacteriota bacterium]